MSQLSDKEQQLLMAVVKNLRESISDCVSTHRSLHTTPHQHRTLQAYPNSRCLSSDLNIPQVDWDKASVDAGYKDAANTKTMWSRLTKKMAANLTAATHDNDGNDGDDAGEGPSDAPAKVVKKRKATGTRGGSSSRKGKISQRALDIYTN